MATKSYDLAVVTHKEIYGVFESFDKYESGTVDAVDLLAALRTFGYNPAKEEIAKMLSDVGKEGSETIDFSDFSKIVQALTGFEEEDQKLEFPVEPVEIVVHFRDYEFQRVASGTICRDAMQQCDLYSGRAGLGITLRHSCLLLPHDTVLQEGKEYRYFVTLSDELALFKDLCAMAIHQEEKLRAIALRRHAEAQTRIAEAKMNRIEGVNRNLNGRIHDLVSDARREPSVCFHNETVTTAAKSNL